MAGILKLQSKDGEMFDVEMNAACQSKVLKDMLTATSDTEDDAEPVKLSLISGVTLRKVIAWCRQHQNDTPVEEDDLLGTAERRIANIDPWDTEFLQVEKGILFEIILAANFLQIEVRLSVGAVCRFVYAESGSFPC